MAAIAEPDINALLQTLIGTITDKNVSQTTGKSTTGSTNTVQDMLQQLVSSVQSLQTGTSNTAQTGVSNTSQSGVQNTNQQNVQSGTQTGAQTTNQTQTQNVNQVQQTSGGVTSSTKSDITKEGVQALIDQVLSSAGGIADISSGRHIAGMYNDTVTTQLQNDFLAKVTGQIAAQTAGTTTRSVNDTAVTTKGGNTTTSSGQTATQNATNLQNTLTGNTTTAQTGQTNTSQNAATNTSQTGSTNTNQTQTGNTTTGQTTTGTETGTLNQKTEAPLGSINWGGIGTAAGLGALYQVLAPSLKGATGGLADVGNSLQAYLKTLGNTPMGQPNVGPQLPTVGDPNQGPQPLPAELPTLPAPSDTNLLPETPINFTDPTLPIDIAPSPGLIDPTAPDTNWWDTWAFDTPIGP
jgi:hypothetical protein